MRILVVEDEPDLNNLIVKKLKQENYTVDSCFDGKDALDYSLSTEYDAIVLDIMLPRINGLEILKQLRDKGKKTPVLLLTAKDSIDDRVTGLNAGADDYLVKPFAFDELLARIRAIIRRITNDVTNIFSIADLILDTNTMIVIRGGKTIDLSSREFAILEYLLRNKDIVLSREKIEKHIWNYDYEGVSNMIDVYIRYLRCKIDEGRNPKLIQTIRGVGYVLREEKKDKKSASFN